MPVWGVIPQFAKLVRAAMKKAGGGAGAAKGASMAANRKVMKDHPEWFKKIGQDKPSSMKPGRASKSSGPSGNAWGRLPEKIKNQLLEEKGKGMTKIQLEKYRQMYRNRNR